MGTDVGPIEKKTIWYHEIIAISPHVRKSEIEQFQK
jgi:hypothetical protein